MKNIMTVIVLSLVAMVLFNGCTWSLHGQEDFSAEYRIGVIETAGQDNKSVINTYDSSLEHVGQLTFNLGSMGGFFYPPQVLRDKMYVIPQGIGNQKELTIILQLDCKTGESKEIEIGLWAANSYYVTEEYIFASSTINAKTTISRVSLKSGERKKITLGTDADLVINQMVSVDDRLYVIGINKNEKGVFSEFKVYDTKTLEEISTQDISNFGTTHLGAVKAENAIYFTSFAKPPTSIAELPDNRLIKYDILTGEFTAFELEEKEPATVVESDGKLYILHSNLVTGDSYGVSIFDIAVGESTYIAFKEEHLSQIAVDGNHLYALNDTSLYKYEIREDTLRKIGEQNIYTKEGDGLYYYIGGMFVNPR